MAGGDETVVCVKGADRLDRFLAESTSAGSRRRAREAVSSGKVTVDGGLVTPDVLGRPVRAGAVVTLHWNRPGTRPDVVKAVSKLDDAGISVVYEDADLVVIDKPAGLLTDTVGREQEDRDSVRARVDQWLAKFGQTAHVVHRIDRDTSGLVVFARSEAAHATLREAFATHVPTRIYWAFVRGVPAEEGTWTHPMRWDAKARRQRVVHPGARDAVVASSSWRRLDTFSGYSVLEVTLGTGRRNQIRVHLEASDMALVGERQYLPESLKAEPVEHRRQALHAWRLSFTHPSTGEEVRVEAPVPGELLGLVGRLRGERR